MGDTQELPSKKRKTLHDYFKAPSKTPSGEPALKQPRESSIPGFSVLPSLVSPSEQENILAFLKNQAWRTDLSRRTIHYGGTYCLMPPKNATTAERAAVERNIIPAPPIPLELHWLIDRMVARGFYDDHARPEFCIVNEYLPDQGISAHVENFRFGEPVCSLTLGSGDFMRFHELAAPHDGSVRSFKAVQAPRTGRREDVWLPSGSLAVLTGDARYRWQHEIVRGKKGKEAGWRRVSLTFRVEVKGQASGRK
ncbi:hypothetical protein W97_02248 [Coniosporium apollinis CBS 100218]|uniref:Fe2OG dioxygenase domain-containing protein n=1 Tax=Coniosporium apollinis (strain CBS 100218) TaxID=1168221 RepID=R7YM92_CONA1|nr:uncharacterized protein W97_02248 [Coniosporium apollinis CBS 100218]EON63022.1 hypothetical protein W97_02248 [Coniosporium apollinis CBS 100218]